MIILIIYQPELNKNIGGDHYEISYFLLIQLCVDY